MRHGLITMMGCLLLLGGCSLSSVPVADPGPTATADDVARTRDGGGAPVFWLGERHAGERLTSLEHGRETSVLEYGKPQCDESGCSWSATIITDGQRDVPFTDPRRSVAGCWHRLGRAVAFACPDQETEPEVMVWTGPLQINAGGFRVTPSAIRPMNRTARRVGFVRPVRFTCAELTELAKDPYARPVLRTLPRALAPRGCRVP